MCMIVNEPPDAPFNTYTHAPASRGPTVYLGSFAVRVLVNDQQSVLRSAFSCLNGVRALVRPIPCVGHYTRR